MKYDNRSVGRKSQPPINSKNQHSAAMKPQRLELKSQIHSTTSVPKRTTRTRTQATKTQRTSTAKQTPANSRQAELEELAQRCRPDPNTPSNRNRRIPHLDYHGEASTTQQLARSTSPLEIQSLKTSPRNPISDLACKR